MFKNSNSVVMLGVNSGTSVDSIDLAVISVKKSASVLKAEYLAGKTATIPTALKEKLLRISDDSNPSLLTSMELDLQLGHVIGKAVAKTITKLKEQQIIPDAVASHGQTIRHLPRETRLGSKKYSLSEQIGSPAVIAAATNLPVIADFRKNAIAVGGEGAPITTGAMRVLFDDNNDKLIVNIGGMSNYFLLLKSGDSSHSPAAADCGPGNVLSDLLMRRLYQKKYDRNGTIARQGVISQRLLTLLLSHPFYTSPQISTGREAFGVKTADEIIDFGERFSLPSADLVATAAELTSCSIVRALKPILKKRPQIKKLYLTGGGRKNIFFKDRLQKHLPDISVSPIDTLGIDGDYTEAAAYAVMGAAFLFQIPLDVINKKQVISGSLTLPVKDI